MQGIDWARLQRQLSQLGERRLVLLEGARAQAMDWLRTVLPTLAGETRLWVGDAESAPTDGLVTVAATKARQWLGRETDVLIWDGWAGNPPDSVAALSGTLNAGGLWFWLVPPLTQWPSFDDPDYARTGLTGAGEHPFARRLAAILSADPDVIRINLEGVGAPSPALASPPDHPFAPGSTPEQQQLIDAIVKTGQGRRRRPLVVTADRGRGKSAALGIAAVRLLQGGRQRIVVTAPSPDAVRTLFRHACLAAGGDLQASREDRELVLDGGRSLTFWALDELLDKQPEAELVMVDEAAAIPASQLQGVLLGWPRCVFASTIHGYEGAGRGFSIRFRSVLQQYTPQWRSIALSAPIRWAAKDPLERLTAQLFLLNASAADGQGLGELVMERWEPKQAPEAELSAAFGLLVDAHYRTTPGDLRQWLDDPGAVSWRVRCGNQVVAVLWGTLEGGLEPELAQAVAVGRRRLRGHLLPQSLANHSGFAEAACLRVLRVVRVAVSDLYRRQGLGQRLVAAARDHALREGVDAIGTSYGGSADLLAFWQQCRLPLVRLGVHREASSGEYAVQRLLGLSELGRNIQQRLSQRFAEHWLVLLPAVWPELAAELVLMVTAQLPPGPELSDRDLVDLDAFAEGYRGFELTLPVLRQFSRCRGVAQSLDQQPDATLWSRAVLQGWSWSRLQAAGLCLGRREGERQLRLLVRETLELVNGSI